MEDQHAYLAEHGNDDATDPAVASYRQLLRTAAPVATRHSGWLGEAEGLEATIAAADQKLLTMRRGAPVKLLSTSPPVPPASVERDADGQRP